ncbi:MAG: CPBP family glutamic-type intramembrane protease [Hyphomonadaceae bacterium]
MTADRQPPGPIGETIASLKRLPDLRGALEGLALFIMVLIAGAWAANSGILILNPVPRDHVAAISISAFILPALTEEIAFRGWVRRGAPIAAVASLLAYIAWHPLQTLLNLPYGRPEFLDPAFLGLIAWLGLACTLARLRSSSIWPPVAIHWGVVVIWKSLYGG